MKRLLALSMMLPLLCWAEPATVIRATDLKQEPATDSATVAALPENTSVEALERKSGWTRVKAASGEGWVRMLALRFGGELSMSEIASVVGKSEWAVKKQLARTIATLKENYRDELS